MCLQLVIRYWHNSQLVSWGHSQVECIDFIMMNAYDKSYKNIKSFDVQLTLNDCTARFHKNYEMMNLINVVLA